MGVRGAVELCGLPGSGKTTVARLTREELLLRGVDACIADLGISAAADARSRIRRRAVSTARQGLSHPLAGAATLRTLVDSRQASTRDLVAYTAQWFAIRDLVGRSRTGSGVHLFEEGIVQRLWTLGLRGERDVSARLWAGLRPALRTDLVLALDADVTVAAGRLERRASRHSRTQQLSPDLRRAELERGSELLERLLAAAPVPVVRLPRDATPDELAVVAADAVLRVLTDDPVRQ